MSSIIERMKQTFGISKVQLKGCILGLDGTGRTTALYKWKLGEIVQTIPTIGFNVENIDVGGAQFVLFDVGGCSKIRSLWRHYFFDTNVVLFFWTSTTGDYDRHQESEEHLQDLVNDETLAGVPICVLASQADLDKAGEGFQIVESRARRILGTDRERLFIILPYHSNCENQMAALEWAVTAINIQKIRQTETKIFQKEKEEGAKLAQWLIDCQSDESDEDFLSSLESGNPKGWDHRVHLRLAWVYLIKFGRQIGKDKIFQTIKHVIDTSEVARKTTFHLTMTYFWIQMVHYAIVTTRNPDSTFATFLVLNPQLSDGSLYLHYYTKEKMLNNSTARTEFVLPDIKKLPDVVPK